MMRKMVLVPYDKYERLLSGQFTQPKPLSITDTDRDQVTIDSSKRDNLHPISPDKRTDDLLTSLPLSLRSRAEVILNHLNKHTNLHWNDKGEIIIDGQLIKGSNITDLIKIQLKDYKPSWCGSFQSTCSRKQRSTECVDTYKTQSIW